MELNVFHVPDVSSGLIDSGSTLRWVRAKMQKMRSNSNGENPRAPANSPLTCGRTDRRDDAGTTAGQNQGYIVYDWVADCEIYERPRETALDGGGFPYQARPSEDVRCRSYRALIGDVRCENEPGRPRCRIRGAKKSRSNGERPPTGRRSGSALTVREILS
jgi:hypothetical protein